VHVIVVGGGAAGLAAAWRLNEGGAQVTMLEQAAHFGGRCHAIFWHGDWRITGAFAFTSVEENLIEQARKLGIYTPAELLDLSGAHTHDILKGGRQVISLQDVEPLTIMACNALPWREKLYLGKALPHLLREMLISDWRDPTSASRYDTATAADYFADAPGFVEYLLEPIMQHFNGFGHDDLSIAWLIWILGGKPWSRSWWSFKDRGVGRLTQEMAAQLEANGVHMVTNATVEVIRCCTSTSDGAQVTVGIDGASQTLQADAVVCAVPGDRVNSLVTDLPDDHRNFFAAVRYGALYLSYFLVELPEDLPHPDLPEALILPTADGFETTAYYNIQPVDGARKAVVHAEMKGAASAAAHALTDIEARDALWADVVAAAPRMAPCRIDDFILIRNDTTIVKPYVGYIRALEKFHTLPAVPNLAFAGDYLITSTVGQAHYTGIQAAESLLA